MTRRPKDDPNERDDNLRTPLMRVMQVGVEDLATIRQLLRAGADPNARDDFEDTPLHYAAQAGYANAIDLLISAGADPTARSYDGRTPLMVAAEAGCIDAIHMLGSWSDTTLADEGNARFTAQYARDEATLAALLGIGSALGIEESAGRNLLVGAASRSDGKARSMCEFLLSRGVDPSRRDEKDRLPEDLVRDPDAKDYLRALRESVELAKAAGESSGSAEGEARSSGRRRRI